MKVMRSGAAQYLRQGAVFVVFVLQVTQAADRGNHDKYKVHLSIPDDGPSEKALGISTIGNVYREPRSLAQVHFEQPRLRREADPSSSVAAGMEESDALLQTEEHSTITSHMQQQESSAVPVKIIIVCMVSILALVGFCAFAVWLVWLPMSAVFEERAYEQAAKQALLDATPNSIPDGSTEPRPLEEQQSFREEQLRMAWAKFLDNPLLQIKGNNLLARCMRSLLDRESFSTQLQDLFNSHAEEGAISRQNVEKVVEAITGTLYNMHVIESISAVEYKNEAECSMAVATVEEDYCWLFDCFDDVFPQNLPMDGKAFAGVVKLVLVWNCVRTLHTARHMKQEHHAVKTGREEDLKNKVKVSLKIDLRQGSPLEASSIEVVRDDDTKAKGTSRSSNDKALKRRDSWSDDDEEKKQPLLSQDDVEASP
jgi:hypothetical protein